MPATIPNQGEEHILNRVLGQTLYLGLMANSVASFNAAGENLTWADIVPVTNFVGADEKTLTLVDWTIPTGANSGDPATLPTQTFTADTGGASSSASGYYIRTADNKLLAAELHPEVASSGTLKVLPAGAIYQVTSVALGAS